MIGFFVPLNCSDAASRADNICRAQPRGNTCCKDGAVQLNRACLRRRRSTRVTESIRLFFAPLAGELVPRQSELDQALPVVAFGGGSLLHRGLGFVLWIVLGTHALHPNRPIWTCGWQFRPYHCGLTLASLGLLRRGCSDSQADDEAVRPGIIRTDL